MAREPCPRCSAGRHKQCANPTLCPCSVCRTVTWSKPPSPYGPGDWMPDPLLKEALVAAARGAVPGSGDEWAKIHQFPPGSSAATKVVTRFRKGRYKELPVKDWELRSSRGGLWLRYVGPLD